MEGSRPADQRFRPGTSILMQRFKDDEQMLSRIFAAEFEENVVDGGGEFGIRNRSSTRRVGSNSVTNIAWDGAYGQSSILPPSQAEKVCSSYSKSTCESSLASGMVEI